jgi:predicted helicase
LGVRKQFIDFDNCKELILDYEKCEWAENQRELKETESNKLRGHACRAVDYYNYYEHDIKGQIISRQW